MKTDKTSLMDGETLEDLRFRVDESVQLLERERGHTAPVGLAEKAMRMALQIIDALTAENERLKRIEDAARKLLDNRVEVEAVGDYVYSVPLNGDVDELVDALEGEPDKGIAGLALDTPEEWGLLFAAAPEMYEALILAKDHISRVADRECACGLGDTCFHCGAVERIDAVISKAGGGSDE